MMKMRNFVAAAMVVVSLAAGASNVMACGDYCSACGNIMYYEMDYSYDYYSGDYGHDPAYDYSYSTGNYILPQSNTAYYVACDLAGLSNVDLLIARNEIYARHGRLFNDQSIQRYFNSKSWYYGYVSPNSFSESVFNDCEQANLNLIIAEERARGSQVTTLEGYF